MTKQSLWQDIKQKAPDLAEFLKLVHSKLGKPEAVINVKFNDK